MKIHDFTLEIDHLIEKLDEMDWTRIGLQFPEGLKPYANDIILMLKQGLKHKEVEFMVSATPCYGACDIADTEFLLAGAEGIVHFGHAEIPSLEKTYQLPVIFQEVVTNIDVLPVVKKALELNKIKGEVSLTATVQYVHQLPSIRDFLLSKGVTATIHGGSNRITYPGQVLGCDFSAAIIKPDAEMHLFIGDGLFHALGISLATRKTVIATDPRTMEIKSMDKERERILRKRYSAIQELQDAGKIGVLVSTLPGQKRMDLARSLVKKGTAHKKEMILITLSHLNVQSLQNLRTRVLVSTACPRVAIDDYDLFREHNMILTTPLEFLIAIGEMDWEDYVLDSFN